MIEYRGKILTHDLIWTSQTAVFYKHKHPITSTILLPYSSHAILSIKRL